MALIPTFDSSTTGRHVCRTIGQDACRAPLTPDAGRGELARRRYGYEPEEVVGKANSSMLHVPEDIQAGRCQEIMQVALRDGKWEGTLLRARSGHARDRGSEAHRPGLIRSAAFDRDGAAGRPR